MIDIAKVKPICAILRHIKIFSLWYHLCVAQPKKFPMEDFKIRFADYLSRTCIPSNAPKEEYDSQWREMNALVQPNIPQKLYRFRSCNLDNFISLEQETIPVCIAGKFHDKYDSLVYVNKEHIYQLMDNVFDSGVVDKMYGTKGDNGIILSIVESKYGKDLADVLKTINSDLPDEVRKQVRSKEYIHSFLEGIEPIIQDHITYMQRDRVTKIACFTEDILAKHMWDNYADGYSGFALEYDLQSFLNGGCETCPNIGTCDKAEKNYTHIFPVIYSDQRYDATENIVNIIFSHLLHKMGFPPMLLPIDQLLWYKSYLYKSRASYAQEAEWRMICHCPAMESSDVACISDRKSVKAIYYGPDIEDRYKSHLRKVAQLRGLDEYEVSVDLDNPNFELKLTKL